MEHTRYIKFDFHDNDFLLAGWLLLSANSIICQKLDEVWGLYD